MLGVTALPARKRASGFSVAVSVARNDLHLVAREPAVLVTLVVMPVVVMAFLQPVLELALQADGYAGANGSEQSVPGLACVFSFFLVSFVGYGVFQEHVWNTWNRLRITSAGALDLMLGKAFPPFVVALFQQTSLFLLGTILFDFTVSGSLVALAGVSVSLCVCLVSMGMALAVICNTVRQVQIFGNLSAVLLGALGGALAPIELLPSWAQTIAPASPAYWAMSGFNQVVLDGAKLGGVLREIAVLWLFSLGFLVVTAWRFRADRANVG